MKIILSVLKTFLTAAIVLAFASCKNGGVGDCFKSTGGNATESRPVADFSEIYIHDNANVIITQDSINSIVVEAGDHLLSEIKTTIADGKLIIENDNSCNFVRSYKRKVYIYVHVKNLKRIDHYGSQDVTSSNTITSDDLETNNWSSGNVKVGIRAKHAFARTHVAAGDVTFSGTTDDLFIYNICEGFIYCQNLAAKSVIVICRGTGDCHASAENDLTAILSGDGYIYYYGNPSTIHTENTGSGQLVHVQ